VPAPLKARQCSLARSPSDWVYAFYLSCNDEIAVHFRHGQKIIARTHTHPGPYIGVGGVPAVCCLYPSTAGALGRQLYELALGWPYGGEFVHRFLYKIQPYRIVPPPRMPCAGCATRVHLGSSANPSCAGDAVTFTAAVANGDGTSFPGGRVAFDVDGSLWPPSKPLVNGQARLTTSLLQAGSHAVATVYQPDDGFQSSQASLVQVVRDCGSGGGGGGTTTVPCCPNALPTTLYATYSNGTGSCTCLNGLTVVLQWDGTAWTGTYQGCGSGVTTTVKLQCSVQAFGPLWAVLQSAPSPPGCLSPGGQVTTYTCNPPSFPFTFSGETGCCQGSYEVTVTP
jgi:hypothetical protein